MHIELIYVVALSSQSCAGAVLLLAQPLLRESLIFSFCGNAAMIMFSISFFIPFSLSSFPLEFFCDCVMLRMQESKATEVGN